MVAVERTLFVKDDVCVKFTLVTEVGREEELGVFGLVFDLLGVTMCFWW